MRSHREEDENPQIKNFPLHPIIIPETIHFRTLECQDKFDSLLNENFVSTTPLDCSTKRSKYFSQTSLADLNLNLHFELCFEEENTYFLKAKPFFSRRCRLQTISNTFSKYFLVVAHSIIIHNTPHSPNKSLFFNLRNKKQKHTQNLKFLKKKHETQD
jgi:hypothetical protein